MRVLVACEESGRVRDAFLAAGHEAMSCDLLPTAVPGPHYQGNVFDIIDDGWDMMIAHPPCTFLCLSGARWFYHPDDKHLPTIERRPHPKYPERAEDWIGAVIFFQRLQEADVSRICIENSQPLGRTMTMVGRYTQVVQPWMFGEPYSKGAYLWLKNLPPLQPYFEKKDYDEIFQACHREPPGPDRAKRRSRTYRGIAEAMAKQWGDL